ncbi:MAG: hypothetical protein WCH98_12035, partial [Verrucomicrobiota bacterium]
DESSPRKFTRLSLLDAGGTRALWADTVSNKFDYRFTCLMAQKHGDNLESAFTALIEPYAGEPLITSKKSLRVEKNESDALRAVAVEVVTRNGHTDAILMDGRPDRVRDFAASGSAISASGEFAYLSKDKDGLRQASLTGGTLLKSPDIEIRTARREYTGKVVAADYHQKSLEIDSLWPAAATGGVFEIGTPEKWTSYTSTRIAPSSQGSTLTVSGGADQYNSPILTVSGSDTVNCSLRMALAPLPGQINGWVASNEQMTKFWRANVINAGQFQLVGGPVAESDFAPTGRLRLWEYGVGDTVRQSTMVSVRRGDGKTYTATGNVDAEITIRGKKHSFSADQLAAGVSLK